MEKEKRILIVDDEEDLCEILQYNLASEGYISDIALSSEDALKKNLDDYDLLILDIMMGEMSGFKLADKIRKEMNLDVPVIFLTARDTENDLLTGFSLGADDYMTKPFSVNELKARVRAVLYRTEGGAKKRNEQTDISGIEFDTVRKKVFLEGEPVDFTRKEYELLSLLMKGKGRIFSREDILHRIWGDNVVVTDRTVDVNVARLRNKMGKFGRYLRNKTGYGYYFEIN